MRFLNPHNIKFSVKTAVLFLCFFIYPASASSEEPATPQTSIFIDLHECKDDQLGIKFLCNPDWELETDEGMILVVISADPAVTMTIAKTKSPVIFMKQLNDETLQEIGQYAPGFIKEDTKVARQEAIKIEGYSLKYPEIRLLDFYFIHDFTLYSVLFSVNPREQFQNYQPLFDKIIAKIKFIPQK